MAIWYSQKEGEGNKCTSNKGYILTSFKYCAELARDALRLEGYTVIAGYMSPVNDAYKKEVDLIFHVLLFRLI